MGHRVLIAAVTAAALGTAAQAAPAGQVAGHVTVTDEGGLRVAGAEIIVYLVGFSEPGKPGATPVKIAQKDRKFVPELVAITVGERVSFPNLDPFLHNVFSQSAARRFDLGSFRMGDAKTKDFPRTGVVDVYCNIHPDMAATILVLPNRRHVRAAADGSYLIDGVPPGHWTVFAYTRRAMRPASAPVTIEPGKTAQVDLALVRGPEPEHLNKYGEHYHDAGGTYR